MSAPRRRSRVPSAELLQVVVLPGHRLELYRGGPVFAVWLNPEALDADGVCLAVSTIRRAALTDAVATLKGALKGLQELLQPPAEPG